MGSDAAIADEAHSLLLLDIQDQVLRASFGDANREVFDI
jgi:hypothetical protein